MKTITELLKLANAQKTVAERAQVLKDNDSKVLKVLLSYTFNPLVEWKVNSDQSYRLQPNWGSEGAIYSSSGTLRIFVNSPEYNDLNQTKRDNAWTQFLESLVSHEADTMKSFARKEMPFSKITKAVAEEAYPGISTTIDPWSL